MDADDGKKPIKRKSRGMTQKAMVIKNRSKGIKLLIKYNQDGIFVGDTSVTPRFPIRLDWRIRTESGVRGYILGLFTFFFFQSCTCTCGYTNNFYNNKNHLHTQKNYQRSGVHQNLYTYTKSHLLIQILIHVHI